MKTANIAQQKVHPSRRIYLPLIPPKHYFIFLSKHSPSGSAHTKHIDLQRMLRSALDLRDCLIWAWKHDSSIYQAQGRYHLGWTQSIHFLWFTIFPERTMNSIPYGNSTPVANYELQNTTHDQDCFCFWPNRFIHHKEKKMHYPYKHPPESDVLPSSRD